MSTNNLLNLVEQFLIECIIIIIIIISCPEVLHSPSDLDIAIDVSIIIIIIIIIIIKLIFKVQDNVTKCTADVIDNVFVLVSRCTHKLTLIATTSLTPDVCLCK